MAFHPFKLEEWQSEYETEVPYNLADSGVLPVRLGELLDEPGVRDLLDTQLHYPVVNGPVGLRARIAARYPGAGPDNVLVTVGASEANAIAVQTLVEPGQHVVVLEPGYRQVRGLAANLGARVEAFPLREADDWAPDLDELDRIVRPDTALIAITNPNNPTGRILTPDEVGRVIAAAERVGAWVLADEVYQGTEIDTEVETPTAYGRYDRLVAVGSLSKAYGLPGLRAGWLVAPVAARNRMWRRHEYTTIATGALTMELAAVALAEPTRSRLLDRNRALTRAGLARLERWIGGMDGLVSVIRPQATALAFVRYHLDPPSEKVAHALREDGVLVGVGAHFGEEHHLRITHALAESTMDEALARIGRTLRGLAGR